MAISHRTVCAAVFVLFSFWSLSLRGGDLEWPGFQGPAPAGLKSADLPLEWSPEKNIAWTVELEGYGQSSPVVWGKLAYVTSVVGKMKETCLVAAYDVASGEKAWEHRVDAATEAESSKYISKAAPSPVVDENGLVVLFEGGNLFALTLDGKPRWDRNLVKEFGEVTARHGLASSLEQNDEHVFVWIERQEDPYVMAVSKATGETVWKAEGLGVTSWGSPRLIPVSEGHHLVLSGIGKIAGVDPKTGKHLWSFDEISGNSTPTPIPVSNGRFLIGASQGRGGGGSGSAAKSNGLLEISETAPGEFQTKFVWQAKKATSSFGSPLAHDGNAYFVNRSGVVFCLDLESGEEHYAQRTSGSIWATPIAVGNRIYLFGKSGATTVIKSGAAFEQLAENPIWESAGKAGSGPGGFGGPVLYAAVAVDSRLILRRGDVLYCVER